MVLQSMLWQGIGRGPWPRVPGPGNKNCQQDRAGGPGYCSYITSPARVHAPVPARHLSVHHGWFLQLATDNWGGSHWHSEHRVAAADGTRRRWGRLEWIEATLPQWANLEGYQVLWKTSCPSRFVLHSFIRLNWEEKNPLERQKKKKIK